MLVLFFPWGNVGLPDLCPMKPLAYTQSHKSRNSQYPTSSLLDFFYIFTTPKKGLLHRLRNPQTGEALGPATAGAPLQPTPCPSHTCPSGWDQTDSGGGASRKPHRTLQAGGGSGIEPLAQGGESTLLLPYPRGLRG